MIFLTGAIASLPVAFFITTGQKYVSVGMSNKFDSKMSGIVGIGTIQLITGLVIQFSGEFIQHSLQEVAQISVNSQISSFVPVNPEVRAAFGIGLILLWVNLHLTVEGFNIDSLGDSKVENGLFILVSVLLVVL